MTSPATISLFIATRAAWTTAMTSGPAVAAAISACYASFLVRCVLILMVRDRRRSLIRVDAVVLATADAMVACGYPLDHAAPTKAC
jgi:hypothetical protein